MTRNFFKYSLISLAVLGINPSFAMTPGYFIGVEGLDLRPMNGDLTVYDTVFGSIPTLQQPSNNKILTIHDSISTHYNWNWRLFGGVRAGDDDFTLSWLWMRSTAAISAQSENLLMNVKYIGTNNSIAKGHVNFDLDDVYGVWGHTVYFNNPWQIRFAAGLEYAHLDSDLLTYAFSTAFSSVFESNVESSGDLKGLGPRIELDLSYGFPNNFRIFANTNTALLVSKREIDFSLINVSTGEVGFNDRAFENYSTRHVVVPKFGMKLGVAYTLPWGQIGGEGSLGSFVLSAGWQGETFIHAIERQGWDFASTSNDTTKVSNFSFQGLFLGIMYTC